MGRYPLLFCLGALLALSGSVGLSGQEEADPKRSWIPEVPFGSGVLRPRGWSAGCGVDSLYFALSMVGLPPDYFDLVKRTDVSPETGWTDLNTLWQVARELGAYGVAIETKEEHLKKILSRLPPRAAILQLRPTDGRREHLVCAYYSKEREIALLAKGNPSLHDTWRRSWTGVAVVLSTEPLVESPLGPSPRIHLDSVTFKAGEQANSTEFPYCFVIRNTGEAALELKRAFSSCACASARLTRTMLEPDQSAELVGKVEVGDKPEERSAMIAILSNDPVRPRVDVVVTWRAARPLLVLDPPSLTFPSIIQGTTARQTVELTPEGGASLNVREVRTPDHWLQAFLDAEGSAVIVTAAPDWSAGKRTGSILIVSHEGNATQTLPVNVNVVPAIAAVPAQVFCHLGPGEDYGTKTVTLRAAGNGSFRVLTVQLCGIPGSVAVEEAAGDKQCWNMTARLGPFGESAAFATGNILLRTSLRAVKELRIPVYIRVAK